VLARSAASGARDPSNGSRFRFGVLVTGRTTSRMFTGITVPFHQFTGPVAGSCVRDNLARAGSRRSLWSTPVADRTPEGQHLAPLAASPSSSSRPRETLPISTSGIISLADNSSAKFGRQSSERRIAISLEDVRLHRTRATTSPATIKPQEPPVVIEAPIDAATIGIECDHPLNLSSFPLLLDVQGRCLIGWLTGGGSRTRG
jgi:hypothetical protein